MGRADYKIVLLLILFILVSLGIYRVGFSGPMIYDSDRIIDNIQAPARNGILDFIRIFPQRPVAMVSFYLNYALAGMDPPSFRFVNAVLLAATSVVLVVLINLILQIPSVGVGATSSEIGAVSVFLGLFFLVHPVQTYVVLYVWQRMALMACLFYFLAMTAYIAGRSGRWRRTGFAYFLTVFFFVLATFSKENAVTLPGVIILMEIGLFRENFRQIVRSALLAAAMLAVPLSLLWLLEHPHGNTDLSPGILATVSTYYQESGLSLVQVILSQCSILFSYIVSILLPLSQNVKFMDSAVISKSLFEPRETIIAVVACLALVGAGVILLRRRPLTGFGVLFFLVNLVPESLLVPQYLFFGYRAVLPMAGLLLVIADALLVTVAWCRDRSYERKARIAGTAIIASLVLATGVVAHHKAELWQESAVFWRDVVRNLPTIGPEREKRPYVHCFLNLGLGYEKAGKISDAVQAYERALEVDPQDAASLVILAKALALSQNFAGASLLFNRALALKSPGAEDRFLIHFQYASFLDSNHSYDEALHHYQEALKTGRHREKVYHNMGIVMKQKGSPVEALTYFSRAAKASPQFGEPRLEMAKIYFSRGRFEEALAQCIQAQKLGADCRPDLLKKSIMEKLGQRIGQ